MSGFVASGRLRTAGLIILLTSLSPAWLQEVPNSNLSASSLNCTTTENYANVYPSKPSLLEEPKAPQYRQSSREEQQNHNRYINDHLDIRYSNRYFDHQKLEGYTDEQLNRHLDEQNNNKNLNFRPVSKQLEHHFREVPNEYIDDQNKDLRVRPLSKKIQDEESLESKKYLDDRKKNLDVGSLNNNHSSKYLDDDNINRNQNDRYPNNNEMSKDRYPHGDNISRNRNDQYLDKYDGNYNLNRYVGNRYPTVPLDNHDASGHNKEDKILKWHSDEEDFNKNLKVQPLDEHPIKYRPDKYSDNYDTNRDFINEEFNKQHEEKNLNKDLKVYPPDKYSNTKIPNEYFDNHHQNENNYKNLNERPTEKVVESTLERHIPESHYDRGINDNFDIHRSYSNSGIENGNVNNNNQNLNTRVVNQYPVRRYEDKYSNKHLDDRGDLNYEKHLSDINYERRPSNPNYERHLVDEDSDKHFDFQDYTVSQKPDRYSQDLQPDRHLDHQNVHLSNDQFDKQQDDLQLPSHLDDPSFERRLGNPDSDSHFDIAQPDNHQENSNFKMHVIGQQTEKRADDIRLDRRLSEDDYDQHVSFKQTSDRDDIDDHHSDVRIEKIHSDSRYDDNKGFDDDDIFKEPRKESNVSHLVTFTMSNNWDELRPKLNFPKKSGNERYKMATLHLDKGLFLFDFLRIFLSFIQPRNVPIDLLKDTLEGKVNVSTLISKSLHLEVVFFALVIILALLMFVIPSTECYLCCKPHTYKYKRNRQGPSVCLLCIFAIIMGVCVVTMLVCNEQVAAGIERIPETIEAALQDLRDYSSGTALQLRKCLTRSLDVASEAILADLDNVEELLGKPIQAQLSQETGVDVALDALMNVANASQELAYKTDGLMKRAERAREFSSELSREVDDIRRDLERTTRDCSSEDRSLCAVLDPSGLHLALRLERVARDDRLLRLRATSRDNLTEVGRQARGEYLYVPHHVARSTLEARNKIRREINTARAKVSDEARSIEASGSDLTHHLDSVRRVTHQVVPYVRSFENMRWIVGFATTMCLLFLWLLLFCALLCRCGCCEHKVRPTLLWFACLSCLLSIALWLVLIVALAIASHAEMLLCRPLDDPEYRTVEAVLETRVFLGRRLSVPLKDLFEKCEYNQSVYSGYQLDSTQRLDQLTAHWSWTGLSRAFNHMKVDLTGLRILSPNLRERLQNLLYAAGSNLTEHRVMIQGPILNKDLNALSEQVENVARQLRDRRMARSFQTIAAQMRDLMSRRVKPLMKMQDELVYQLAALELHLQPLQRQVNQTLAQLRAVQYHIDNQGDKIGQIKTKAYLDRLSGYLDQWRAHVLTEVSSGVAKCRPLWDILRGIKMLFCSHILGPLNGYWFSLFISVVTLLLCTPTAHKLATSYWTAPKISSRGSVLLSRQGSPDTIVLERETWQTPHPAPSMESW